MALRYGRGADREMNTLLFSDQWLFGTMLVSAFASLLAAFVLSTDAVTLAADPNASLTCNISSVVSCGKVAVQWQASLLGFPNAFIGLMCEPVVITIAVAGLSNIHFKKWFMFTAQAVYFAGLIFALWLFSQSAFVIHAFCPWCMLVTIGTTLTFFTMLRYNIREGNIYFRKTQRFLEKSVVYDVDLGVGLGLIAVVFAIIFSLYGSQIF